MRSPWKQSRMTRVREHPRRIESGATRVREHVRGTPDTREQMMRPNMSKASDADLLLVDMDNDMQWNEADARASFYEPDGGPISDTALVHAMLQKYGISELTADDEATLASRLAGRRAYWQRTIGVDLIAPANARHVYVDGAYVDPASLRE